MIPGHQELTVVIGRDGWGRDVLTAGVHQDPVIPQQDPAGVQAPAVQVVFIAAALVVPDYQEGVGLIVVGHVGVALILRREAADLDHAAIKGTILIQHLPENVVAAARAIMRPDDQIIPRLRDGHLRLTPVSQVLVGGCHLDLVPDQSAAGTDALRVDAVVRPTVGMSDPSHQIFVTDGIIDHVSFVLTAFSLDDGNQVSRTIAIAVHDLTVHIIAPVPDHQEVGPV